MAGFTQQTVHDRGSFLCMFEPGFQISDDARKSYPGIGCANHICMYLANLLTIKISQYLLGWLNQGISQNIFIFIKFNNF